MNLIVLQASALSGDELAAQGLTGIPADWPIQSQPYLDGDTVPDGWSIMTDADVDTLKANNQASYDAWIASLRPIVVSPPPPPVNSLGIPLTEISLRHGTTGVSNFTIVSHDFSDRTTWYQKSLQVTAESLTNPLSDGITYLSANAHWINMNNPKMTYDYKKILERDGTLSAATKRLVSITSNGTALVEGTDYTVDYAAGSVLFAASQSGKTVLASYWHNSGVTLASEFLWTPPPNTKYIVEHVETQFTKTAVFVKPIQLEIWAGAVSEDGTSVNLAGYGGFADAYYDAGYGQSRSIYRNLGDLLNWCTNSYPTIPACGDFTEDILCMPFLYTIHPIMNATQGAVIRVFVQGDEPVMMKVADSDNIPAEICTVTLYMEKGPI